MAVMSDKNKRLLAQLQMDRSDSNEKMYTEPLRRPMDLIRQNVPWADVNQERPDQPYLTPAVYQAGKFLSGAVEKPLMNTYSGLGQAGLWATNRIPGTPFSKGTPMGDELRKGFSKMSEADPLKHGILSPMVQEVKQERMKKAALAGTGSMALTMGQEVVADVGAFFTSMKAMSLIPFGRGSGAKPLSDKALSFAGNIKKYTLNKDTAAHLTKLGTYGWFTSGGEPTDRFKSAATMVAYNSTFHIANATGLVGLKATTVDSLMNMGISAILGSYKGITKPSTWTIEQAEAIVHTALTDVGFALMTRGTPENQVRRKRFVIQTELASQALREKGLPPFNRKQKADLANEMQKLSLSAQDELYNKPKDTSPTAPEKDKLVIREEHKPFTETDFNLGDITKGDITMGQADMTRPDKKAKKGVAKADADVKNVATGRKLNIKDWEFLPEKVKKRLISEYDRLEKEGVEEAERMEQVGMQLTEIKVGETRQRHDKRTKLQRKKGKVVTKDDADLVDEAERIANGKSASDKKKIWKAVDDILQTSNKVYGKKPQEPRGEQIDPETGYPRGTVLDAGTGKPVGQSDPVNVREAVEGLTKAELIQRLHALPRADGRPGTRFSGKLGKKGHADLVKMLNEATKAGTEPAVVKPEEPVVARPEPEVKSDRIVANNLTRAELDVIGAKNLKILQASKMKDLGVDITKTYYRVDAVKRMIKREIRKLEKSKKATAKVSTLNEDRTANERIEERVARIRLLKSLIKPSDKAGEIQKREEKLLRTVKGFKTKKKADRQQILEDIAQQNGVFTENLRVEGSKVYLRAKFAYDQIGGTGGSRVTRSDKDTAQPKTMTEEMMDTRSESQIEKDRKIIVAEQKKLDKLKELLAMPKEQKETAREWLKKAEILGTITTKQLTPEEADKYVYLPEMFEPDYSGYVPLYQPGPSGVKEAQDFADFHPDATGTVRAVEVSDFFGKNLKENATIGSRKGLIPRGIAVDKMDIDWKLPEGMPTPVVSVDFRKLGEGGKAGLPTEYIAELLVRQPKRGRALTPKNMKSLTSLSVNKARQERFNKKTISRVVKDTEDVYSGSERDRDYERGAEIDKWLGKYISAYTGEQSREVATGQAPEDVQRAFNVRTVIINARDMGRNITVRQAIDEVYKPDTRTVLTEDRKQRARYTAESKLDEINEHTGMFKPTMTLDDMVSNSILRIDDGLQWGSVKDMKDIMWEEVSKGVDPYAKISDADPAKVATALAHQEKLKQQQENFNRVARDLGKMGVDGITDPGMLLLVQKLFEIAKDTGMYGKKPEDLSDVSRIENIKIFLKSIAAEMNEGMFETKRIKKTMMTALKPAEIAKRLKRSGFGHVGRAEIYLKDKKGKIITELDLDKDGQVQLNKDGTPKEKPVVDKTIDITSNWSKKDKKLQHSLRFKGFKEEVKWNNAEWKLADSLEGIYKMIDLFDTVVEPISAAVARGELVEMEKGILRALEFQRGERSYENRVLSEDVLDKDADIVLYDGRETNFGKRADGLDHRDQTGKEGSDGKFTNYVNIHKDYGLPFFKKNRKVILEYLTETPGTTLVDPWGDPTAVKSMISRIDKKLGDRVNAVPASEQMVKEGLWEDFLFRKARIAEGAHNKIIAHASYVRDDFKDALYELFGRHVDVKDKKAWNSVFYAMEETVMPDFDNPRGVIPTQYGQKTGMQHWNKLSNEQKRATIIMKHLMDELLLHKIQLGFLPPESWNERKIHGYDIRMLPKESISGYTQSEGKRMHPNRVDAEKEFMAKGGFQANPLIAVENQFARHAKKVETKKLMTEFSYLDNGQGLVMAVSKKGEERPLLISKSDTRKGKYFAGNSDVHMKNMTNEILKSEYELVKYPVGEGTSGKGATFFNFRDNKGHYRDAWVYKPAYDKFERWFNKIYLVKEKPTTSRFKKVMSLGKGVIMSDIGPVAFNSANSLLHLTSRWTVNPSLVQNVDSVARSPMRVAENGIAMLAGLGPAKIGGHRRKFTGGIWKPIGAALSEARPAGLGLLAGFTGGVKLGAAAGSPFGPVGATIGGVAGGVLGGVAGAGLGKLAEIRKGGEVTLGDYKGAKWLKKLKTSRELVSEMAENNFSTATARQFSYKIMDDMFRTTDEGLRNSFKKLLLDKMGLTRMVFFGVQEAAAIAYQYNKEYVKQVGGLSDRDAGRLTAEMLNTSFGLPSEKTNFSPNDWKKTFFISRNAQMSVLKQAAGTTMAGFGQGKVGGTRINNKALSFMGMSEAEAKAGTTMLKRQIWGQIMTASLVSSIASLLMTGEWPWEGEEETYGIPGTDIKIPDLMNILDLETGQKDTMGRGITVRQPINKDAYDLFAWTMGAYDLFVRHRMPRVIKNKMHPYPILLAETFFNKDFTTFNDIVPPGDTFGNALGAKAERILSRVTPLGQAIKSPYSRSRTDFERSLMKYNLRTRRTIGGVSSEHKRYRENQRIIEQYEAPREHTRREIRALLQEGNQEEAELLMRDYYRGGSGARGQRLKQRDPLRYQKRRAPRAVRRLLK